MATAKTEALPKRNSTLYVFLIIFFFFALKRNGLNAYYFFTTFSIRFRDGNESWKSKLVIPPKDRRVKTTVREEKKFKVCF